MLITSDPKSHCTEHGKEHSETCRECTSLQRILSHIINRTLYKKVTGQEPVVN